MPPSRQAIESRMMQFCMTIGAKDDAFFRFSMNLVEAAVRQRAQIDRKLLSRWINVVPSQRREVPAVAASAAARARFIEQCDLAQPPSFLLLGVILVSMVRIDVLANARAELALPTG